MDTVTLVQSQPAASDAAVPIRALPPESPLPMPVQSLRQKPARAARMKDRRTSRRALVGLLTLALTATGAHQMYLVLAVGGLTVAEGLVLGVFTILFAWIAVAFVGALVGFMVPAGPDRTLGIDPAAPLPPLESRIAMLLPTYNEAPHRIMARLKAIYDSIEQTGRLAHFDFFVLSDSTDPEIWVGEEAAYLQLVEQTNGGRVFYRHRARNTARKAGNIGEWVQRYGGAYAHMIVLDADSLMTGDTVVRLAAAMERHEDVGLIQTLPVIVNGTTLFARMQQFAGRMYGPVLTRGAAWWHGADSNYWGHNAIIRVRAFAEAAGLPELTGRKPFGGHILSHDFVEAALMRRAGWGIRLAPSLGGSYEEGPPTLIDHAARDRRWCQGNLQHVGVLTTRGLRPLSRLHLAMGIGSYIASPIWLLFLLLGIVLALQAQFIRPEYFPRGYTLFPQWPAQDPVRAAYVFAGTMAVLFLPKTLGWLSVMARRKERRGSGGLFRATASALIELVLAALIAPVMMLSQCKAVLEVLLGRDAGWQPQRREHGAVAAGELARWYARPTLLGAALAAGAFAISLSLFLWMTPVIAGLVLAIPIALLTSSAALGAALQRWGLLQTPEEHEPPEVVARANALAEAWPPVPAGSALRMLQADTALLALHCSLLPAREERARGSVNVDLVVALAKLDDAETVVEAEAMLTRTERFALLTSRQGMDRLAGKR